MTENTFGDETEVETCAVCEKDITGREVFAQITQDGVTVSLCCPLCEETFQNDPVPYVKRCKKLRLFRSMRNLVQPHR